MQAEEHRARVLPTADLADAKPPPSASTPGSSRDHADPWEEIHDTASGRSYFFNSVTNETTWEDPREADGGDGVSAAAAAAPFAAAERRSSSDSARLSNVRIPIRSDRSPRRSSNGDVAQRV